MDFAQTFLLAFILTLLVSLVLTIVVSVRSKSPNSFLLSFIIYWFLTFCLMYLAQYWMPLRPELNLPLSYVGQFELLLKVWGISACVFILVPLIFAIVSYFNSKRPDAMTVKGIGLPGFLVALIMVMVAFPSVFKSPDKAAEAQVKANLHTIQITLERYGIDHGDRYPGEINDLIKSDYLTSFPINPFSRGQMQEVDFGDPNFEGNFTYVPVIVSGEVIGYNLLGYGARQTDGLDINDDGVPDHVIINLGSGVDTPALEKNLSTSQPEILQ